MGQSGSVELTAGHLQNNSGGKIYGVFPEIYVQGTDKENLEQDRNFFLSIGIWIS